MTEPPHRWWLATPFGLGVVQPPLGPNTQIFFWVIGPRGGQTTLRPLGVAEPPLGQKGWPATPEIFYFLFYFKKKLWWGHFGNKKAKWVELLQFESLGGVKCHILNFGGKSTNRWILQESKIYFPQLFFTKTDNKIFNIIVLTRPNSLVMTQQYLNLVENRSQILIFWGRTYATFWNTPCLILECMRHPLDHWTNSTRLR